jgi:hypothetical protein
MMTFPGTTGSWSPDIGTGSVFFGPDGGLDAIVPGSNGGDHITALGGISGFIDGDLVLPLVGVFTGSTIPGTPPATLNFTGNENFTTLSPLLDQVFYIGDGLTGTGSGTLQDFMVPAGATELYLGAPDSPRYNGAPGAYGDNVGYITVNPDITYGILVPEPISLIFFGTGLVGVCGYVARRRNG